MKTRHLLGAWVLVLALGASGCTKDGSAGGSSSSGSVLIDSSAPTEGSGAESPQAPQDGGPEISVASLPIGGDPDVDGVRQCAQVNWLGADPIPSGVSVSIDRIGLDPSGVFRLTGQTCGSDRPCTTSWAWGQDSANEPCTVAVEQVVESEEPVDLVLSGTVHCVDDRACAEFRRASDGTKAGGTQIRFTPEPLNTGSPPSTDGSPVSSPSSSGD